MRCITEDQLEDIAIGAGILGTGGGGDPGLGMLIARTAIRQYGPVQVVELSDVPDDALIVPVVAMGAPTVANEKLPSLEAMTLAVKALASRTGASATHTMAIEIGGIAALLPIAAAAELGIPVIDGDMMGRAFPELQMVLPSLFGIPASPLAMADEWGNTVVLECRDNRHAERLARAVCVEMGSSALMALYSMSGAQARPAVVSQSLLLAERLGAAVRAARAAHTDPVDAIVGQLRGHRLFLGKVTDLVRRTEGGFARLEARVDGVAADEGAMLRISSQNEHLVAVRDERVVATTPDLIIVVDSQTGEPITTEALRYGARVTVIGAPCDPRYRSTAGLAVVGPRAFGYAIDFQPVELLALGLAGDAPGQGPR